MSIGNIALVEAIEQELKRPIAEPVRTAFLSVDRRMFVPAHYEQHAGGWEWQETGEEAYQDRQLVVKISNGLPSSSSSKPSLMAMMLEALDLHPGQRVLEIGTGTGYNAALMGQIVGKHGQVSSIDIDAALIQQAHNHLAATGASNVVTYAHNGFQGYEPNAPYDLIIATAGFQHLPQAWSDQLVTGGLLVGNILWPVVRPLLRLRKTTDTTLTGTLLPLSAIFMEMHHGEAPKVQRIDWETYDRIEPITYLQDKVLIQDLHRSDLLLLLACQRSTVQRHWRAVDGKVAITLIDLEDKSSITISDTTIIARGNLLQTVNRLRRQEIPALADYQICIHQGQLSGQSQRSRLPDRWTKESRA